MVDNCDEEIEAIEWLATAMKRLMKLKYFFQVCHIDFYQNIDFNIKIFIYVYISVT